MYPILIKIGPLSVHAYGFMVAMAFLVGIIISIHYGRQVKLKPEVILDLALYIIIAAIVGSRLMYVIGRWDYYKNDLLEIFMVQKGGLAFLGGFGLALLTIFVYARRKKINLLSLFDVLAPGLSIGYAIARIGCFLNGCCFGRPTNLPFGIRFPFGSLAYSHYHEDKLHPTQLYAMILMLIVFGVIVYLWKRRKYDGQIFYSWLVLYGGYRFVIEFFRFCPPELYWLGLNPGQLIALILMACGAWGLLANSSRSQSSLPGA